MGIERDLPTKWSTRARVSTVFLLCIAACKRVESSAGPPTADRLAKACIAYVACDSFAGSVGGCIRASAFIDSVVSVYRPGQIRCMAEAGSDCTDVLACIGVTITTCDEQLSTCDGDTQITCSGDRRYEVDCTEAPHSIDGTCIRNRCGYEPCSDVTMSRCNGTRLEHCELDGVRTGIDCALFGEVCIDDGSFARCEPARPFPCSFTFCDGDSLIDCDFTGHRRDCSSLYAGGQCSSRLARCGYDDACSPEAPSICIGDSIGACVLGQEMVFDCIELGFTGCVDGRCTR